jgi:hypothetical protein
MRRLQCVLIVFVCAVSVPASLAPAPVSGQQPSAGKLEDAYGIVLGGL